MAAACSDEKRRWLEVGLGFDKAIVTTGNAKLEYRDVPVPTLAAGAWLPWRRAMMRAL